MFSKLASAGINAHEAENIVFESAEAAIARINVDRAPDGRLIESFKKDCPASSRSTSSSLGATV